MKNSLELERDQTTHISLFDYDRATSISAPDEMVKKKSGSYYTKPEIVSLIFDLVGYTVDYPLYEKSFLEPSTGQGAFLIPAVERLLDSVVNHLGNQIFDDDDTSYNLLHNAIRSIEVNKEKHEDLIKSVTLVLMKKGVSAQLSQRLLNRWLVHTDFLFWNQPVEQLFDFIVGNPPYIRIENIEVKVAKKYRSTYKTLFDRADIYVAFIEHSLEMLKKDGLLSFICTDRFTKNRYGKEIRRLVNEKYQVLHFLDIHNSQPFIDEVSAYPCIFTFRNAPRGEARTLKMDEVSPQNLQLARSYLIEGQDIPNNLVETHTIKDWFHGIDPWVLNGKLAQTLLKKVEANHPLISESPHTITIGIGVATGATAVYIIKPEIVDIEPEVLLPTVTKDDITQGYISWGGHYVINPYNDDGSLVDLGNFPKLKSYLMNHEELLRSRSTAKNNPSKWYKTIDRIFPERLKEPKLLIPDIKLKNLIVFDEGNYYPEHSLYYITAGTWDIKALQALLVSSIIKFFIWSYATKMRGDYLRYQAQYLRKIRLPVGVTKKDCEELKRMYQLEDYDAIDQIVSRLYNLSADELRTIQELVQ
ncbi:Modification methylase PaeR7I [Paenibacillus plantiphilus]|uniref:site-specific DNA-methyltransferase (adenine-specific) n=1 Tax=Paenibacillus plantiphilus TaxID=2905650 RepID=A0ABM9CGH2_9BACL|nr:Eco57I restriction-modification methylase domain-containing protein [Paenibacillus plantiphilus]CAH1213174.1 Modification methylase PaeR7I [Paenibacillus plantiphilus]